MARKRRPYDLIYLMTFEFLISILAFYSAVIIMVVVGTGTEAEVLDMIGPNAPSWVVDGASGVLTAFSAGFMVLALLSFLLLWGFLRARSFSWTVGILASVASTVVGLAAILTIGYNDYQTFFRFLILVIAPMCVIYLLMRNDIKAYLMG
jgi:hypothetical protein